MKRAQPRVCRCVWIHVEEEVQSSIELKSDISIRKGGVQQVRAQPYFQEEPVSSAMGV